MAYRNFGIYHIGSNKLFWHMFHCQPIEALHHDFVVQRSFVDMGTTNTLMFLLDDVFGFFRWHTPLVGA